MMAKQTLPILDIQAEPDLESTETAPVPGSAVDVLARTLWGEARGEPVRGIEAVAAVVMNRVARAKAKGGLYWWGGTVETVCRKPWQFSCWNASDPNAGKLANVTTDDRRFRVCVRIARRAVGGVLDDPTNGATHYHRTGLLPAWARHAEPSAEIGNHLFYANVE
jgi:spore germination cell wall hydrolase CwlJ-like protein